MRRLFALGLLLLAQRGLAADACLTGTSTTADQRALATLRTDVEANCPCAVAFSRKSFQRCARGRIDAALAATTLRPECSKPARKLYRATTCGAPDKVTCGRIAHNDEVTCRVKKPGSCRSHGRYVEHACTTLRHCSDVVDWTAGTCDDVRANGAYRAGAMVTTYTKPSFVDPNQTRTLKTYVWYPTTATGPIDPGSQAILNAPLAATGPLPVVMFSHGSCGIPNQSPFLTTRLASRGFIVAAPPHPGNTLNEFPACASGPNQSNSLAERPRDIMFVLDELLAANQDPGSPFFGAIDPARIGMAGHSFGGLTTQLVVGLDSRFIAAMPLAPASITNATLHLPSLHIIGAVDAVVNNTQTRGVYDRSDTPKYWASILNTGHYAFSNNCFPNAVDCQPPKLTQPEAHAAVLRYAIPFLEAYVAGDDAFLPFLAVPAPPGTIFESVVP